MARLWGDSLTSAPGIVIPNEVKDLSHVRDVVVATTETPHFQAGWFVSLAMPRGLVGMPEWTSGS